MQNAGEHWGTLKVTYVERCPDERPGLGDVECRGGVEDQFLRALADQHRVVLPAVEEQRNVVVGHLEGEPCPFPDEITH